MATTKKKAPQKPAGDIPTAARNQASHLDVSVAGNLAQFWRAGFCFTKVPTRLAMDDLTDDQVEALLAEPRLNVVGIAL